MQSTRKHYVFVIRNRAAMRSNTVQWNSQMLGNVMICDFLARGSIVPVGVTRRTMMMTKTALILATTASIALAGFEMRPAQAAPEGGPAVVKQANGADEFSSQKKRRRGRGVNPAVPLAAFGAILGTIGAIAAANRQREVYYGPGPYYYGEPTYVAPRVYHQPHVYHRPHVYHQPRIHHAPPHVRHHHAGPRGHWRGAVGHSDLPAAPPMSNSGDGRL